MNVYLAYVILFVFWCAATQLMCFLFQTKPARRTQHWIYQLGMRLVYQVIIVVSLSIVAIAFATVAKYTNITVS